MKTNENIHEPEMKPLNNVVAVCTKTGLLVGAVLIIYFLIMKLLNLHEVLILRVVNLLFLALGILSVLRFYTKNSDKIPYLQGIKIGAFVTFFAVIPFAVFIFIYLTVDPNFMVYIQQNSSFGEYLNPAAAAFAVVLEGVVSGLLFTYITMPYFKKK